MKITKIFAIMAVALFSATSLSAQWKITREEYIKKYKDLVVESQDIYGIPASIKMAQALLESDNGNSRLATEGNNHFGIKCKSDWKGLTITHDDDAKGECFRKYASAEESFKDHSEFLDRSPRYQSLFDLDPMDYKAWAYGLKSAGYATNPKYPELLIKIIDDYQLYLLDQHKELPEKTIAQVEPEQNTKPTFDPSAEKIDVDNYMVSLNNLNGYAVYHNNGSEFVIAADGDTYSSLGAKFNITTKRLASYNDTEPQAMLSKGDVVYIKKKAKRANNGKLIHVAKDGETMHSIAQRYGIRLKNLCSLNHRDANSQIVAGQQIRLM